MRQDQFEQRYQSVWDRLEEHLAVLEKFSFRRASNDLPADLPGLYRQACNHYALAPGQTL